MFCYRTFHFRLNEACATLILFLHEGLFHLDKFHVQNINCHNTACKFVQIDLLIKCCWFCFRCLFYGVFSVCCFIIVVIFKASTVPFLFEHMFLLLIFLYHIISFSMNVILLVLICNLSIFSLLYLILILFAYVIVIVIDCKVYSKRCGGL